MRLDAKSIGAGLDAELVGAVDEVHVSSRRELVLGRRPAQRPQLVAAASNLAAAALHAVAAERWSQQLESQRPLQPSFRRVEDAQAHACSEEMEMMQTTTAKVREHGVDSLDSGDLRLIPSMGMIRMAAQTCSSWWRRSLAVVATAPTMAETAAARATPALQGDDAKLSR